MASSRIQMLEFKLKVFESSGNTYQDLFAKVMAYAHPEFKKISVFSYSLLFKGYTKIRINCTCAKKYITNMDYWEMIP